MTQPPVLLLIVTILLGVSEPSAAWNVKLVEKPSMLVGFPGSTAFQQSQNPSFVPRSKLLPGGGLMVRRESISHAAFRHGRLAALATAINFIGWCCRSAKLLRPKIFGLRTKQSLTVQLRPRGGR